MAYSLLCADMDGTLLNDAKEVTERTRAAIRAAFAAGKTVTLATGRLPRALRRFGELVPEGTPLICCNGALIVRAGSGEVLLHSAMEEAVALPVLDWGREHGATLALWQGDRLWMEGDEKYRRQYEISVGCPAGPLAETVGRGLGEADKILFLGTPEAGEAWTCALSETPLPGVKGFLSGPGRLELVREDVDKGYGVRQCAALLGLPMAEVIAVGDEENDLPMLRAAGLTAAMGNATPEVRDAADVVAPSNEEDGVAWLIERYLL